MFKARAVVVVGIVVLPALAVAGLSRTGMPLAKVFSRNAVLNASEPITSPVIHTMNAPRSATPISAQPNDDLLASIQMRDALVRIVDGAASRAEDLTASIKLTFDDESTLAYVQRNSLGLIAPEEDLRLTRNASPIGLNEMQVSDSGNDSLLLDTSDVNAGAFYSPDSLTNTLFPAAGARILAAQGIEQGDQAPVVNRLEGHNAGFAGTDGRSSGRRHGNIQPVTFDRPSPTEEVTETGVVALGDDVPAPGTLGLSLVALVALRRRRA